MKASLPLLLAAALLAGCSPFPVIDWPNGPAGATPALVPLSQLGLTEDEIADPRGDALAAQAAALKSRAAAIGG